MSETDTVSNFDRLYTHLLKLPHPVRPPPHATDKSLTAQISSLRLHPTLEAALHLLNGDLPSAHFLVRQMQAAPAYEGMMLHGILHRMEGDYDNTRAWFRDVKDSDVFTSIWKDLGSKSGKGGAPIDQALSWVSDVEAYVKEGRGEEADLEQKGREEIEKVVGICRSKFGDEAWDDARSAYTQPEGEHKQLGQDMITGGKGFRQF